MKGDHLEKKYEIHLIVLSRGEGGEREAWGMLSVITLIMEFSRSTSYTS